MCSIQLLLTLSSYLLKSQTLVSSLTLLIHTCLFSLNRVDSTFKTYRKLDNVSSTYLSPSQDKSHYLSAELLPESDNRCPDSCPWPLQSTLNTAIVKHKQDHFHPFLKTLQWSLVLFRVKNQGSFLVPIRAYYWQRVLLNPIILLLSTSLTHFIPLCWHWFLQDSLNIQAFLTSGYFEHTIILFAKIFSYITNSHFLSSFGLYSKVMFSERPTLNTSK